MIRVVPSRYSPFEPSSTVGAKMGWLPPPDPGPEELAASTSVPFDISQPIWSAIQGQDHPKDRKLAAKMQISTRRHVWQGSVWCIRPHQGQRPLVGTVLAYLVPASLGL